MPGQGFGGVPPVAPYQAGGGEPGYIATARYRSRHLLRRHQQRIVPDETQPAHRRVQGGRRLSAVLLRRAGQGRQGTLAVDVSDHLFLCRPQHALHQLAARLEDDQRRRHVGGDQRRPVEARPEDDGGIGRADHARHEQPGDLRHGVLARTGQEGSQPDLGRVRRWPRARHARRGQDVGQRDADRHARLRPREPARWLDVRQRHGLHGREEDAARRSRRRTSSRPPTTARRGRRSSTASRPTITCTPCARMWCGAGCCTRAPSTASTSPSTTARRGRSSTTACRTCR